MTTDMTKKIHEGQNIKRFREMLGIKQEALAHELGEDWTQSKVSNLEAKDTIDPSILDEVSRILKIPVEAIRNFDEDAAITIVANTINNNDHATGNSLFMYQPSFSPVDKVVELYEWLLKEKDVEIEALKKQVSEKKK